MFYLKYILAQGYYLDTHQLQFLQIYFYIFLQPLKALPHFQYVLLKSKLSGIIDNENDSIRFYIIGKKWNRKVEIIGQDFGKDLVGELIV